MEIKLDVQRFQADLKKLNFSDKKPVLTKALITAVKPTAEVSASLAPVDTGLLSRSIRVEEDKRNKDPDIVTVRFGPTTNAFYGFFQEFGTAHMTAQPFLQPAIDQTFNKIEDRIVDSLNREIDKALA